MEQLIVNAAYFGGIFTRKGERCIRIDDPFSGRQWLPILGREVIVARKRVCSENYIPADCLPEAFVAGLPGWAVWYGRISRIQYVCMRDIPTDGIDLIRTWRSYVCRDGGRTFFTVPAGTTIIPGEPGSLHEAGHHWEV